ncbi:MAG TPA: FG-GAP-like repeat-containing protein [Nannocystaceae bacterium]|nr:FG-GAP-like repeat-containing protein [Nannocystaceae bacterium]
MVRVDTAVWNLGLPLALLGGCSEIIKLQPSGEDGGSSSGGATTIGSTVATTMPSTDPTMTDPTSMDATSIDPSDTATTSSSCGEQCPPGYCCVDTQCMNFYCPPKCPQELCCYGMCPTYNCYVDDDCGPGSVCQLGGCMPIEMEYECMLPVQLEFQIPIPGGEDVRALAFIDADGDAQRDVVVGEGSRVQLLRAYDFSLTEIDSDVEAASLVVADLDGDMDDDVLVGDRLNGGLRMLVHDPMVSFTPVYIADMPAISAMALGDTDGDSISDLIVADDVDGLLWLQGLGGGGFGPSVPLGYTPTAIAMGSLDGDMLRDVVLHQNLELALLEGVFNPYQLYEESAGTYQRLLAVGNFDGVPPDDVVALHTSVGTTVLTSWQSTVTDFVDRKSWWIGGTSVAARADLDDDGHDDLIAAGAENQFVVAHGASVTATSDVIDCVMTVSTAQPIIQLAVGDFTGDGDLDVVTWTGMEFDVYVQTG